jgi:DNA-binding response OmpR family regulator
MENLAGPEPDPCRVLVVEDDMDLASVYSAILREAGMQVLVTDPASAGDRAQDFHPDLVLLDLTTPTCRRFELAGTIRKHQFLSSVPLICLTCEEEPATVRQEAPAADWLQKPYDPEKLIALIRERIDAAHARA